MILLLEEALQGRTATDTLLHMDSHHDITILAGLLWFDDHIVTVTNVILDHRASLDDQGIGILVLCQARAHINKPLIRFCENIERLTGCNRAYNRHTICWPGQLDTATLFRLTRDESLFFQHTQMIVNMPCACNVHRLTNLAIGGGHTLSLHILSNECIHAALYFAGLL